MKSTLLATDIQELIIELCKKGKIAQPKQPLSGYQLSTRKMGFRICSPQMLNESFKEINDQKSGKNVAEVTWKDSNGTLTFASLYEDKNGELFELDIWNSNFGTPETLSLK